jgi:hypothetical protein
MDAFETVTLVVAILSVPVIALPLSQSPKKLICRNQERWIVQRRSMGERPIDPHGIAHIYQDKASSTTRTSNEIYLDSLLKLEDLFLQYPEWQLESPIALSRVQVQLDLDSHNTRFPSRDRPRTVLPMRTLFRRFDRYSTALSLVPSAKPKLFDNDPCYRVDSLVARDGNVSMRIAMMQYFDFVDEGESLRHEWAIADGKIANCQLRTSIGDPRDFARRPCAIGLNVLTIRRRPTGDEYFLQHRIRDEFMNIDNVLAGSGEFSTIPNGIFQPTGTTKQVFLDDSEDGLVKCVVREFAEEMLGVEQARELHSHSIDYENTVPYNSLMNEIKSGGLSLHLMGFGINPLTFQLDFMIAGVFAEEAFLRVFEEGPALLQRSSSEGDLAGRVVGGKLSGIPLLSGPGDVEQEYGIQWTKDGELIQARSAVVDCSLSLIDKFRAELLPVQD